MRLAMVVATLLLLAAPPAPCQQPDSSMYRYHLARSQAGDPSADFGALRMAWAATAAYTPYSSTVDAHRDTLRAAIRRDDLRRIVEAADSILATEYVDIDAHIYMAYGALMLGDTLLAQQHRAVGVGLLQSILDSGEGTREAPWVVISVREEYAILKTLGFERIGQSLGECAGKPCDILRAVERENGQEKTFCFDISIPHANLRRLIPENSM